MDYLHTKPDLFAMDSSDLYSLPVGPMGLGDRRNLPFLLVLTQGLKPRFCWTSTARLKSCPDTKRSNPDYRKITALIHVVVADSRDFAVGRRDGLNR